MFSKIKATEQQAVWAVRPPIQAAYTSLNASGQWNGSGTKRSPALSPRQRDLVFKMLSLSIFDAENTSQSWNIHIERDRDP